jgi:uncharacterized protein
MTGAGQGGCRDLSAVEIIRDLAVEVGEGVTLAADLYMPREVERAPALVSQTPYPKDGIAGVTDWHANHYFAAHGYATVLVDVRGTGVSGGEPRPPFDPGEAADGAAVVEWVAAQPWCNGKVGLWGASYGAFAAVATAAARPRSLRAVIAIMGFADPERDFVHPAGRRGLLGALGFWSLNTLAQHVMPPYCDDPAGELRRRWQQRVDRGEPFVLDLLRHGPGDPLWRRRAVDVSSITAPTFCVTGWRDPFCEAVLRTYAGIEAPKQLLVGPWTHTSPDEAPVERLDFLPLALEWWKRWLSDGDIDRGPATAATVYLQGTGEWIRLSEWPPTPTASLQLEAAADATLIPEATTSGRLRRYADATVGAHGDLRGLPVRGLPPDRDEHEDDLRSLAFTSGPLEEAVQIWGAPEAIVTSAEPEQGVLVVKLTDVSADGRSTLITTGTLERDAHVDRVGAGLETLRRVAIKLTETAYTVERGHRLRLAISLSDFPRLWPEVTGDALSVECGLSQTRLELPVCYVTPGRPADLPAAPGARSASGSLVLRADPLCKLTRDAVADGMTVTLGEHLVMKMPHTGADFDMNTFVLATVAPDRPDGAHASGRATLRARGPHGDVVARVDLIISQDAAVVTAEASVGGETVFSRRWLA